MKKVFSFGMMLCLVCGSLVLSSSAAGGGAEQFNDIAKSILIMDTDVSQEQIAQLLTQLEALDLSGEEDQNELTGSMVGAGGQSVQQLFAQLQLQLAQYSKEKAADQLNAIQASQELSAQTAGHLNTARQLYSSAQSGGVQPVPQDLLSFLQDNSLYTPSDASSPDLRDWEAIIQSLEAFQEHMGTNVQTQMEYVQDFMGQYNDYVSQSSALLGSDALAGLSGSATMLGAGGAGLAVTALVAGLAAGSLITALILRRKQSKA